MSTGVEKVQKVVEMTGVSYADAKEALEQTDWDVLAVVISLEQQGKTEHRSATYSTEPPRHAGGISDEMRESQDRWYRDSRRQRTSEALGTLGRKLRDFMWVQLIVEQNERQVAIIPMFLLLLILVLFRSFALIVAIVALFFGVRYRFEGLDAVTIDVNGAMGKMADFADSIVQDKVGKDHDATSNEDSTESDTM